MKYKIVFTNLDDYVCPIVIEADSYKDSSTTGFTSFFKGKQKVFEVAGEHVLYIEKNPKEEEKLKFKKTSGSSNLLSFKKDTE